MITLAMCGRWRAGSVGRGSFGIPRIFAERESFYGEAVASYSPNGCPSLRGLPWVTG